VDLERKRCARRSRIWWFRHYNGFNVKYFLWLKRLWRRECFYVLECSMF